MDFNIPNEDLARLASDPSYTGGFARETAELYRQTLQIVAAVPNESALKEFRCLRYTTLRGRGSRRRIALTNNASLIVRIENGAGDPRVVVERIDQNGRVK